MPDLVIRGGTVYSGLGDAPTQLDLAVEGGRISAMAPRIEAPAQQTIDATGLAVTPGFIDLHGHSDISLGVDPSAASLLGQGITTQLIGNCGSSAFPLPDGEPAAKFDPDGISRAWATAAEYFERLRGAGPGVNVASLVGLGTVRRLVLAGESREATRSEIATIVAETDQAFSEGAVGVSFGLHFEPDLHASTEELMAVARLAARRRRVVAVHLRDYGRQLLPAVDEVLDLARQTGVSVHISLLHAFGRAVHGSIPAVIDHLDTARESGIDVTCEALLWPTVGAWDGLRATLPEAVYDWRSPDWDQLQATARSRDSRRHLAEAIEQRRTSERNGFYEEYLRFADWRDVMLCRVGAGSEFAEWVGQDIASVADATNRAPVDVLLDLIGEGGKELFLLHRTLSEDDLDACLSWSHAYIGLDAIATSSARRTEQWNTMQLHPRHFGTTARLFSHFVRARSVLSEPEAMRRLTSGPAAVLGLSDRGVLAVGGAADIVVLDLSAFATVGTWADPAHSPTGIAAVVVNGSLTSSHDLMSAPWAGHVIRTLKPGAIQ
jgi:N-acyl-D-aspartate/D-glutamate deacylase